MDQKAWLRQQAAKVKSLTEKADGLDADMLFVKLTSCYAWLSVEQFANMPLAMIIRLLENMKA